VTAVLSRPPDPTDRRDIDLDPYPEVRRRQSGARWPWIAALACFVLYAVVGYWMLHDVRFAIGDSLARSSAARSVVDSRDPHLSAIGFVWMPLPTFVQLVPMAVLSRLGYAAYTGMLCTAFAGAMTVPVVARIGRDLALTPNRVVAVTLAAALNPITIFYASNGMSEAWAALFTALVFRAFISWMRVPRVRDVGMLGISLAMLTLCRYEGVAITAVLAVAVAVNVQRSERLKYAAIVALPATFVMLVWCVVSKVLLDDALFWLHGLEAVSDPPEGATWLPDEKNLLNVASYALRLCLLVAPALLFLVPLSLGRRRTARERLVPLSLIAVAFVYPFQVVATLIRGDGWGNLRYFSPLILVVSILLAWFWRAEAGNSRGVVRFSAALLVLGMFTGWWAQSSPRIAAVEGEWVVAKRLTDSKDLTSTFPMSLFVDAAGYLDSATTDEDLIASNSQNAFAVTLFSQHPQRFAIPQDTDFEQLVARNPTRFTWIVQVTGVERSISSDFGLGGVIAAPPVGKQWLEEKVIVDGPVAIRLYHLVPVTPAAPVPED
jgi:hypothetical protein